MMHRMFADFFIAVLVLSSVCRSFLANRRGNNKWISLPLVASQVDTSLTVEQLVAKVDSLVHLLIMNTAHPCLYYSYARCRVLRSRGYPAKLHIGMHNLQESQNAEGHCWISIDGQVVFEETDPHEMYPEKLGEWEGMVYWVRLREENGKESLRLKKDGIIS